MLGSFDLAEEGRHALPLIGGRKQVGERLDLHQCLRCCPAVGGWSLNTANVAVLSLDLAAERYLNLHQCVYSNGRFLYTNLLSNTPNTPFNTGTNISSTSDTVAKCGPAGGDWSLDTPNVAALSLDLTPGTP